jgi:hypothetical protein
MKKINSNAENSNGKSDNGSPGMKFVTNSIYH